MSPWIKPADIIITSFLLLAAVAITLFTAGKTPGRRAVVTVDGQTVQVLDLDSPGSFQVEGPLGPTVIETGNGGVRILSSPCPNHICIRMGEARMRGQMILCVPNRVAIRVEGGGGEGVDGVVG
ncbi:MAG: NusG domain II-containing protein [bacterium]